MRVVIKEDPVDKDKITTGRIKEVIREVMNEMSPERKGARIAGTASDASARETSRARGSEARGSARERVAASTTKSSQATTRTIAMGADHGGFKLKETLKRYLEDELGVKVKDFGTASEESVDYPDFAIAVARAVAIGECEKGVVIDTMGIGSSIAANKIRGIRAAVCHDVTTAKSSRGHNDANVIALGSKVVNPGLARTILRTWLSTSFDGGRHSRRIQKITDAEKA